MDRISVIVPVYNVENYLGKCVDSLLCQTVPPFEIILVDDGSTDSSGAMCDSYAREHPELVRVIHQENAGLGGARDTGIGAAEGNWLLFIDSDDYVAENAISRLTEAIGLGSDIIIFGFTEIGEDGTVFSVENDGYPDGTVLDFSESPEVVFIKPNAWNKLYRRSLFTETGILFPSRVWYEDIRTTVKLSASAGKVAFITDPLYYYLRRSGSIMNNANIVRNAEIIDAFDDLLGWFREKGLFEKYYDALCYLTIYHVYIAASVRVIRIDKRSKLIGRFASYLRDNFPDYEKNPYLNRLGQNKTLIYKALQGRHYSAIRALFKIKDSL